MTMAGNLFLAIRAINSYWQGNNGTVYGSNQIDLVQSLQDYTI